jgi:predicted RNase H-like HicB family nuclease
MSGSLTIIYEQSDDGWWIATIPEIPGAFSQGRTRDEARENALDAMRELMEARREMALGERASAADAEQIRIEVWD